MFVLGVQEKTNALLSTKVLLLLIQIKNIKFQKRKTSANNCITFISKNKKIYKKIVLLKFQFLYTQMTMVKN